MTVMETKTFDFNALIEGVQCSSPVRVVTIDGKPWFAAADAARVLHHTTTTNTTTFTQSLADDEKGIVSFNTPGGPQKMLAVTEQGLYRLLMRSNKAIARPFQDWVVREVIPSIRKTGSYTLGVGETIPIPTNVAEAFRQHAETLIKLAQTMEDKALADAKTAAAEAELARVAPLADVAARLAERHRTLAAVMKSFDGANINCTKRDLERLGYLYTSHGTYKVYSKYRDTLFGHRWSEQYGTNTIIVLDQGYVELERLYRSGKLTMKKEFVGRGK